MKRILNNRKATTKRTSNFDDLEVLPIFPSNSQKLLRKEMVSTLYEYYLVGEIVEASEYLDLIDALRSANETDQFVIRISSCGGLLSTANMIINAINECQAHVHGFIESTCASAATLIYLSCHSYSLSEDADMMIHTSSSLYGGKEHEQHSYVTFSRKKIHKMVRERYAGFLTEKEIENVLNGQDYYFDSEEIAERLETYTEFQQKKFEAELEAFQKEQEDDIEGSASTKPKKKKILPS